MLNRGKPSGKHARPLPHRLRQFGQFLFWVGKRFVDDRGFTLAGSLTYTTLLSLVPLITIALTMITAFPVFKDFTQGVDDFFAQNVLPPAVAKTVTGYVNQFTRSAGKLTAVGIGFLAVTAILLMMTVERAFNVIWRVRRPRPLALRVLTYWAVLTLGPLLIGLSITITSYLVSMSVGLVRQVPGGATVLLGVVPMLLTAMAFTLAYLVVPNRPVALSHAAIGGLAAALMFELMKRGFALYIAKFPSYTLVYGAFAVVPIFLIWVYLSWVVSLLGAVITAVLPLHRSMRGSGEPRAGAAFRDALEMLRALILAQRRSRTLRTREILVAASVPYETGEQLLDDMAAAGWVARVVGDRWALACDPNVISIADVYQRIVFGPTGRIEPAGVPTLDGIVERTAGTIQQALAMPIRSLTEEVGEEGEAHARAAPRTTLVSSGPSSPR